MSFLHDFIVIGFGVLGILISFRVYNPFKGKASNEKMEEWHQRYGALIKVASIALLLLGIFGLIMRLA